MSKRKRKKGPQIITAALLVTYPILCGQAASSLAFPQQQSQYQSPAFFSQTEEEYQAQVKLATQKLSSAKAALASANQKLNSATSLKASAQAGLTKAQSALDSTKSALTAALSKVEAAQTALDSAQSALDESEASLAQQVQNLATAQAALEAAKANLTIATSNLTQAQAANTSAQQAYQSAQTSQANAYQTYQAAQNTTNAKLQLLQTAQANYNNSSIPNPNYVSPTIQVPNTRIVAQTTLVPTTTTIISGGILAEVFNRQGFNNAPPLPTSTETPISTTTVPNINFQWGSGTVLNSGRSEDIIVRFTGNIVMPSSGYYRFYTPADDGTRLTLNGTLIISDWYDKGGGGSVSPEIYLEGGTSYPFTLLYYENGGGAAVQMYYYTPNTGFVLVPAAMLGTTVQSTATTYQEVTTYVEETYYTTEPNPAAYTQGTIEVNINEGWSQTFTAPEGGTFTGGTLRYQSIDRPECGADVPVPSNLIGSSTITLDANNGVYGDPCGGWYKHLTGTLTYTAVQPQYIKDPSLLPAIEAAQLDYDNALAAEQQALIQYQAAQSQSISASSSTSTSQQNLEEAQAAVTSAQSEKDAAQSDFEAAQSAKDEAASENNTLKASVSSSTAALATATSEEQSLTTQISTLESNISSAESTLESADAKVEEAQDDVASTQKDVDAAQAELDDIPPYVAPKPEPEEEEKVELPPLEDLTKVNFKEIVATDLTAAQAEQIKEAALQTFETAEKGSEEYKAALEALFVAAQQNDITVDPALAEIPGVGVAVVALADAINFLGNAGADMSPQVREESEKVVVTAVVAGNAAIAAAAGAASSAASAAAASSGPSSRKIN